MIKRIPYRALTVAALSALLLMGSGCAFHRTVEESYNLIDMTYDRTTFTGVVWLNRTAVNGLSVGKRTPNGSTTLSISKASTETQADAIKATGAAIGEAAVAAVKASVGIP